MPMTGQEFLEGAREAKRERVRQGLRSGPIYAGDNAQPIIWYDQVFGREITPTGTVECEHSLRVGATQSSLDVVIVASHANTDPLTVAEGAMLEIVLMQADEADGTFEEVGPSVCVTAPLGGMEIDPDMLVARFAVGNMTKPWCKVKLSVQGDITGGLVDVALAYMAR